MPSLRGSEVNVQVRRLLEVLRKLNPASRKEIVAVGEKSNRPSEFAGIVFVEQRYVAFILRLLLRKVQAWSPDEYGYLKLDFIVGVSGWNMSEEEQQSLHRRQEEVFISSNI